MKFVAASGMIGLKFINYQKPDTKKWTQCKKITVQETGFIVCDDITVNFWTNLVFLEEKTEPPTVHKRTSENQSSAIYATVP